MRVKIGDIIFDTNEQPIMLIFENRQEIQTTSNYLRDMSETAKKYCIYPDSMNEEAVKKFMKIDDI